jgi:predicted transcriptional regulator
MYPDNPDFDEKFLNAFGPIAFAANRHLIEHMIRAQRELGVDYETLVIWGILAHLNVAHMLPPGKNPPQIEIDNAMKDPKTGMKPLRLRDLEQVTGLPRETIRRKLRKLQARNYILQTVDGWMINREAVDQNMREFTRITVLRLLDTAKAIHTLLDNSQIPPPADAS